MAEDIFATWLRMIPGRPLLDLNCVPAVPKGFLEGQEEGCRIHFEEADSSTGAKKSESLTCDLSIRRHLGKLINLHGVRLQ